MFILLTALKRNSSSYKVIDTVYTHNSNVLTLENNVEAAKEQISCFFEGATPDQIIIFNDSKDTFHPRVETCAVGEDGIIKSNYDIDRLIKAFEHRDFTIESNPVPKKGLANAVYYTALKKAEENRAFTSTVLITLPPPEKFCDLDRFINVVYSYVKGESDYLNKIFMR